MACHSFAVSMVFLSLTVAHDCEPPGACKTPTEEDWPPEGMGLSLLQTALGWAREESGLHPKRREPLRPEPPTSMMPLGSGGRTTPSRTARGTEVRARTGADIAEAIVATTPDRRQTGQPLGDWLTLIVSVLSIFVGLLVLYLLAFARVAPSLQRKGELAFPEPDGEPDVTGEQPDATCRGVEKKAEERMVYERRILIFALMMAGSFAGYMGLSISFPFVPAEMTAKGFDGLTTGITLSCFEVGYILACVFSWRLMAAHMPKLLLTLGNMIGGIATLTMGLIWLLENARLFQVAMVVLRICQGFAGGMFQSTCTAFFPVLFGDVATATGVSMVVMLCSNMVGPVAGGAMWALGHHWGGEYELGYVLPFVVLGSVELGMAFVCWGALPQVPAMRLRPVGNASLSCWSWVVVFVQMFQFATFGTWLVNLQHHLSGPPHYFGMVGVGCALMVAALFGGFGAVATGVLDDGTSGAYSLQIVAIGGLLAAGGRLLVAPCGTPLHAGPRPVVETIDDWVGLALSGLGTCVCITPMFATLLASIVGDSDDERTVKAAAVSNGVGAFGMAVGMQVGGLARDVWGTQNTFYGCSLMQACVSFALLACGGFRRTNRAASGERAAKEN